MYPKNLQRILLIVIVVLQANFSFAQDAKAKCDSLIESGKIALDKHQYSQSLAFLFQALDLARNNGWDNQEFSALNNIGTNYYRLSEFGDALNYYLEGYTIAIKKLTPNEEILILNNIAILYFEEKKYDQAKAYFKRVYTASKENKENNTAGVAVINLGTLAVATNNIPLAKSYYKEALVLLSKPEDVILAKGGLANCELLLGNTKLARQSAEHLLANTKDLEYYHTGIELLIIISKSYLKENKLDRASFYINKIFDKKPSPEIRIKLFQLLVEINRKKNRLDLALQYKDSLFDTTARLNTVKNEQLYEKSKVKFELQNYKNQSLLNEAKLVSERKIFYYVLLFIIVIVLFILWTARNLSLKLKQKKLIAERNEKILALELEKEKGESLLLEKQFNETQAILLLQQEKLKNEVEIKNRKLSAKALYLSGKNEMIEEILSELSVLPQVSKDDTLVSHIQSLKNQLKADNEWNNFITHFEEVNQGFLNNLQAKHTDLTINDIRYISYIYMGLSTKEIASMLNISQDSCRKRKERVLAKMNLPKETNLYEYLTSL